MADHIETKYFIHVMPFLQAPLTYGPFDSQGVAEDWARQHIAIGMPWYCTMGEVVTPDKPPVNPPPTPAPKPAPARR